jgi:hypothetical protein
MQGSSLPCILFQNGLDMKDTDMQNEMKRLQDEIRELSETDENVRRLAFWEESAISNDYWHGIPRERDRIPFIIELERESYAKTLDFSLMRFYQDPLYHAVNSLRIMLFKFKTFNDCTPLGKSFAYYCGAGFEKSLFGGDQLYTEQDAWVAREDIVRTRVDISRLTAPDFHRGPHMRQIREFYEKMTEVLDDDFSVVFPQWNRGPWGVAWHLRGINNLLIDVIEDPGWVGEFVFFLGTAREKWAAERAKYLGTDLSICNIYNDEVTAPVVSPDMYNDIIKPSEIDLSRFFGGVNYWHSCGNSTPFHQYIKEIPNLHMVHISPWSSVESAVNVFDRDRTVIEVALHPVEDIVRPPSENHVERKIASIKEMTSGHRSTVRADGIQPVEGKKVDLGMVERWARTAAKVLLN